MSSHYVIHLAVERVDREVIKSTKSYEPDKVGERKVVDLGSINLKGTDLEGLKSRIVAALDQVTDF